MTNVTLTPNSLRTRAFHGDYLLTVRYFGEVIEEQELTVVRGNNVFNVTIQKICLHAFILAQI